MPQFNNLRQKKSRLEKNNIIYIHSALAYKLNKKVFSYNLFKYTFKPKIKLIRNQSHTPNHCTQEGKIPLPYHHIIRDARRQTDDMERNSFTSTSYVRVLIISVCLRKTSHKKTLQNLVSYERTYEYV